MYVIIIDQNENFAIYLLISFSHISILIKFLKIFHSNRCMHVHSIMSMQTESTDHHLKSHIVVNSYFVLCLLGQRLDCSMGKRQIERGNTIVKIISIWFSVHYSSSCFTQLILHKNTTGYRLIKLDFTSKFLFCMTF